MDLKEPIALERECEAILIPSGTPVRLEAGSPVFITQRLGGNYTVNINGNLARIAAKDADALGFAVESAPELAPTTENSAMGSVDEALVWEQLRTCYDPEIPINIVDLGLIYNCETIPLDEGGNRVNILMTLTAVGCGMGEFLAEDVRLKMMAVPNVTEVNVELTFEPPWDQTMMSEAARLQTGLY